MKARLLLLAAAACLAAPTAAFAQPARPRPAVAPCHIYVVTYRITVDPQGRITDLGVDRISDPSGPGTPQEAVRRPIQLDLPPAYLAAVRAWLGQRDYAGAQEPFYTYTFYNPARPDAADIDPQECR